MKDENETVSAAAHHRVTSQRSRDAPRDSVTFFIFHFSFSLLSPVNPSFLNEEDPPRHAARRAWARGVA
jgi:uncharacterized membrane protein (DUF485 family)